MSEVEIGSMRIFLTLGLVAASLICRETPEWQARSTPIECILRHDGLLDPVAQPEQAAEAVRKTFAAGATRINLGFIHESRAHYIEQLEALAALSID